MNIEINAHSSIRINGSRVIYFDPFEVSKYPFSVGSEPNDADIIFVTHEHFDHFDPESISAVAKADTILVCPDSMMRRAKKESGLDKEWIEGLVPGDEIEIDDVKISAVPSYNVDKPNHPKKNEWLGYVVSLDDERYYVAGDTDVNDDIKEVSCDVALVPVGGTYTMDLNEAAEFIAEIKPKKVVPTHYGSIVGDKSCGEEFAKKVKELDDSIAVVVI